jgi:hypothetical protein
MSASESSQATRWVPIDAMVVTRVVGICLVVANHSHLMPQRFGPGGLNILLFTAGVSMARVAFSADSNQSSRQFVTYARTIAVPSVIVALLTAAMLRQFDLLEVLLVSNWFSASRVSLFPIWYSQIVVQTMLVLALVFPVLKLTERIRATPIHTTALVFGLALLTAVASKLVWDTTALADKVPQLHLWNLVAGWLYWAVIWREPANLRRRVLLSAAYLAAAALFFLALGTDYGLSRFTWFSISVVAVTWAPRVALPWLVRHVLLIVSNATFYIFLFHYYLFSIVGKAESVAGLGTYPGETLARFLAGLLVPIALWVVVTAALRAWRTAPEMSSVDAALLPRGEGILAS